MQISRLFEIVYILLGRRHITARELAERFEVSVRTIYRDVDALSQAGMPVYATQGAGGGIHIHDAYVLNKSALTETEQREILLALESLRATGHGDSDRLLERLGSLFNQESSDWIEVDFSRWDNPQDRQILAAVKDAILSRHLLAFTYHPSYGVRAERTVSPTKLVYKSQAWYLQAYCHTREAFRTFKLVRMENVRVLDEMFDRHALPTPPTVETGSEGGDVPMVDVALWFAPRLAWRVLDEFAAPEIEWQDDGGLVVRFRMPDEDWLRRYIFSFGTGVEVLSPQALREEIRDELRAILARYEET